MALFEELVVGKLIATDDVSVAGEFTHETGSRIYKTTDATLTADNMRGGKTVVVNGSGAVTITLPTVAKGLKARFISAAAQTVHVKAGASDKITLHGTALDDGDKVSSAGAAGNMIEIAANAAGTDWESGIFSGVWSDGGA